MWITARDYQRLLDDVESHRRLFLSERERTTALGVDVEHLTSQKISNDISLDWMRHRVNELSKQNGILLAKIAGVNFPVPEIVPTRPGTMTIPDFDSMPSFEDVGDSEATRLGIRHTEEGIAEYTR